MKLIRPFIAILSQGYISSKSAFFFLFFFSFLHNAGTAIKHHNTTNSQERRSAPTISLSRQSAFYQYAHHILHYLIKLTTDPMAINKNQKRVNSHSADRIEIPTIWSLLPSRYHYDLKVTRNR